MWLSSNPFKRLDDYIIEAEQSIDNERVILMPPAKPVAFHEAQMHSVLKNWDYSRSNRLLVTGPVGIGKSTFIINSAHHLIAKNAYDIAIFIDFKCSLPNLGDLDELIRYLGNALVIGQLNFQLQTSDRIVAIERKLAERKSLLLIDNLHDGINIDIRNFLSKLPYRADMLVSSTQRFPEYHTIIELTKPGKHEAIKFIELQKNALSVTEESEKIAEISDFLPKTLVWIIHLLSEGESIQNISKQIESGKTELQNYYFRSLWSGLNEITREIMPLFVFLQQVDPNKESDAIVLASVFGPRFPNVIRDLSRLKRSGFLEEVRAGAYSASPMMRGFLLANIAPGKIHAATVLWFDKVLERIDELVRNANWVEVFGFIEGHANSLISTCMKIELPEEYRFNLLQILSYYLYSRGMWQELKDVSEFNVNNSRSNELYVGRYIDIIYGWYVRSLIKSGMEMHARSVFDLNIAVIKRSANESEKIFIEVLRASYFERKKLTKERVDELEKGCLEMVARRDLVHGLQGLLKISNLWRHLNEHRRNEECNKIVIQIASEEAEKSAWIREIKSVASGNLGVLYNKQERYAEAQEQLLPILPDLAQTMEKGTALAELAFACFKQKKYRLCRNCLKSFFAIKESLDTNVSFMESHHEWDRNEALTFFKIYQRWGVLYHLKIWA